MKGDKEVRPFMVVKEVSFYRQTHDHIFAVRKVSIRSLLRIRSNFLLQILWILTDYLVRKGLHQESGSGELTFFPDSRLAPVYGSAPITNDLFV